MSSVDDRIVNMQFNNKQFSAGASQAKRDLEGVERALTNAGKNQGLQNMGSSVDGIKAKFSALQVVGVTALASIATSAMSSAKTFLAQFSGMQSAMEGFQEYELKMGSIQTIMANTGESLKTVNAKLNELNEYSDKTIYNFADMTKNIGLFTNAGIGLNDATAMIKGFSNEAAVSGTTAANAAGAAYQLSQALSAGTIRLMDWRSLTNVGMGNAKMKEGIIEIATAMGQFEGDSEAAALAAKDFNGSLEKNWLSADVMTNYLKMQAGELSKAQLKNIGLTDQQIQKFEKQQKVAENAATKVRTWTQLVGTIREQLGSGWAQSAEIVIGDFHQATKLFTNINNTVGDVLGKMTESRNKMLKEWAKEGGREILFESLGRMATSLGSIFKALGQAFRDVFPPSTGNLMMSITKAIESMSKALKPSEGTLENLRSIFGGIFVVLKLGIGIIGGVLGAFTALFSAIFSGSGQASGSLLDILGALGDVLVGFNDWLTSTVDIRAVFAALGAEVGGIIRPLISVVSSLGEAFAKLFSGDISGFTEPFEKAKGSFAMFLAGIVGGLAKLTSPFEGISNFFSGLQVKLEAFASSILGPFETAADKAENLREGLMGLGNAVGATGKTSGLLSSSFDKVRGASSSAKDAVTDLFGAFSGAGASAANETGMQLASAGDQAANRWETVKGVLSNVGGAIKSTFTALGEAVGWVRQQFGDLFGGLDAMGWASLLNTIFAGGAILSIKKFYDTANEAQNFLENLKEQVTGAFGALTDTLETMQSAIKAEMIRNIAIAVALLTVSVIALSFVDIKKLGKSLGAIAIMLGLLVGALWGLGKVESEIDMLKLGASLMLISMAMLNLSAAVVILGKQDLSTLAKGLGAMAITLGIMVLTLMGLSKISGSIKGMAGSIMVLAIAMLLLSTAVLAFGSMSLETLATGLGAMAIALGLMVGAMLLLSKTTVGVEKTAAGIYIMSAAMIALSLAVRSFGSMDMGTLAQGMGAMAIGLALMVGALLALSNFGGQAAVAAGATMVIALALNVLMTVVLGLGAAPWDVVAQGMVALAVALGIVLAAGAIAMAVSPGLIALSIAVGALGLAMALAGVGMLAFGTGFALMAAAGVAGIAVITAAIQAFMAMLPAIAVQVAAAFVSFIQVIANASPKIRKAMGTILKNMIGTVRDAIPEIRALFQDLINAGIQTVQESVPRWIEMGFTIIDKFIESASKHVPKMAENGMKLMQKFLEAIGDQYPKLADTAAKTIVKFVQGTADAINNNVDDLRQAGQELAFAIVNGLTGGLLGRGAELVRNAAAAVADMIPGPVRKALEIFSPSRVMKRIGEQVGEGLAIGITSKIKTVVAAAVAMANAIIAEGNSAVAEVQAKASAAQRQADRAAADAAITAKRAAKAAKAADAYAKTHKKDKKGIKARRKSAAQIRKEANQDQKAAEKAQLAADRAAQRVEDVRTFEEADLIGKGDIRQDEAVALAARARRMLAKANAEAAEAKRLAKTNKKAGRAMLEQAKKDAKAARRLAAEAQAANRSANSYYEQEVNERIKRLEEDAAYDAADVAGKAAILQARAEANEAKAEAERKAAAALLEQAKAMASTDAASALRLIQQAEEAAAAAKEAADQAKREREDAEQLLNPGGSPGGTDSGGGGGYMTPSRSILEDAARAVDRYTESLRQAEELAASQERVVQFVQNNSSPESLSASELYRQTKNLLTVAEVKMGATP